MAPAWTVGSSALPEHVQNRLGVRDARYDKTQWRVLVSVVWANMPDLNWSNGEGSAYSKTVVAKDRVEGDSTSFSVHLGFKGNNQADIRRDDTGPKMPMPRTGRVHYLKIDVNGTDRSLVLSEEDWLRGALERGQVDVPPVAHPEATQHGAA